MNIVSIDPGTTQSGFAILRDGVVRDSGVLPNAEMLQRLPTYAAIDPSYVLAIEMVASYGMAVGREVFETCVWIGRFQQAWRDPDAVRLVYRKDVKRHLCGGGTESWTKAKDSNVWQAVTDILGAPGTKAQPGGTYGVKSHARAALAVAITVAGLHPPTVLEMHERGKRALEEFGAEA